MRQSIARKTRNAVLPLFVCLSLLGLYGCPPPPPVQDTVQDTVQDFDTTGSPYTPEQFGVGPPPTVMPGGPTGDFLRLVTTTIVNVNTITFELTAPGVFDEVIADFDFRMIPGFGRADGFGFALLNTANFDTSGAVGGNSEEANYPGSLGIGFDIHRGPGEINNNHISIHFDGTKLTEIDASPVDLASGQFIHAQIIMTPGAGFSDVSVILTPPEGEPVALIDSFPVPGFMPYEGRVHFGARSGGQSADHDLDNIHVQFNEIPVQPNGNPNDDPVGQTRGQWSDVIDSDIIPIHLVLLPTGKVLYWQNGTEDPANPLVDEIRIFDPSTNVKSTPTAPPFDNFCAGHAYLEDGRLLVAGGHIEDFVGLTDAAVFDPVLDTWATLPPMNAGRWYPSATTLANGDVLVLGGDVSQNTPNPVPQVWNVAGGAWHDLSGAEDPLPLGDDSGGIYPRVFLAPDGRVFKAGPQQQSWYLCTDGTGAWIRGPLSDFDGVRSYGSAVLYDEGKILIVGGGGDPGPEPPTATAEVIDLNDPAPEWRPVGSMAFARRHLNATLLPDGTVLVTGGTSSPGFNASAGAVLEAELWDPETEEWTTLASMQKDRVYHSTALLLPDGKVIVGGGGRPPSEDDESVENRNFEIFSPPYLFKGPRPEITSSPTAVGYGESFRVVTPDANDIEMVSLIRLGAATHAFDQNQRINKLVFTASAGELALEAPSLPALAPPGHYMLLLINNAGVPSIASVIQLR